MSIAVLGIQRGTDVQGLNSQAAHSLVGEGRQSASQQAEHDIYDPNRCHKKKAAGFARAE